MNPREATKPESVGETTLESWKEIAAYLQRQVRTVRRWEQEEGLPINRHSHKSRSSVYAFPREIDAWRRSRRQMADVSSDPAPTWRRFLTPSFVATILLCLIMVGNGIRPQAASAKSGPLAKRLVCTDCGDSSGSLTPDGRLMLNTDWGDGDLTIRDMSTGKVKRMMLTSEEPHPPTGEWVQSPFLSPDRRQILYDWDGGKQGSPDQLRIIANEPGAKPRVLIDDPAIAYFETESWFPDGKSALVNVKYQDQTRRLVRVSLSDGSVNMLKRLDWRVSNIGSRPRLSPDGRYIAYAALTVNPSRFPPASTDSKDVHVYIFAADGSSETEVIKTAGINKNPIWTADGKHLLFTSDRAGQPGLWSIPMKGGQAAGIESLVSAGIGDTQAVGIAGGSYYYTAQPKGEYIHIASISGENKSEAQGLVGIAPAWSPDGKSLAFKRRHAGSDRYDLIIHSLESREEKMPLAGLGTSGPEAPRWWSPDSIVTTVARNDGPLGAYRVNSRSGELKELLPHGNCVLDTLSPDAKTVFIRCKTEPPFQVRARDLATGQERVLASYPNPPLATSLSPDGRTLAIGWTELSPGGVKLHIFRVSTDGSGYREVFISERLSASSPTAVAWDRDGRSIQFTRMLWGSHQFAVMRIPAEGGPASEVFAAPHGASVFDLSPDGSRIAYGMNESVTELWALDNVLPMLKER